MLRIAHVRSRSYKLPRQVENAKAHPGMYLTKGEAATGVGAGNKSQVGDAFTEVKNFQLLCLPKEKSCLRWTEC